MLMQRKAEMKVLAFVALLVVTTSQACEDQSHVCQHADCRTSIMQKVCCKTCSGPNPPTRGPPLFTIPPRTCGRQEILSSRLAGGSTAKAGSWPWQVLIFYKNYRHCGGTIISPNHIATGAHCIPVLSKPGDFIVRVGEYDVNIRNEGYEVDHEVSSISIKGGYSGITRDKDLAIMKLKQPIQFNTNVQPACLPLNDVDPGTECVVVGWGQETDEGNLHTVLKQARLPIVQNDVCQAFNGRITTDNMLCAGDPSLSNASGACHGDSGGGLVCQSEDNRWTLHGILSYGHDHCDPKKLYSVFTRVRNFRAWIEHTMTK